MPKVSKQKKTSDSNTFEGLSFPDIETNDDEIQTESGSVKAKKGDDQQAALLASLQQQVAQLNARNEELQRTTMALMAAPTGAGNTTISGTTAKMDMSNLPDPTLDPEKYAQEVANRASQFITAQQEANMRASSVRNERENRVQTLWNDFENAYGDYADPDKVDFIAQRVVKNMQSRGVDPEKYMFGAKETFFRDVVSEYEKVFGKPGGEDNADTDPSPTDDMDTTPANRTGGIFGGLESGHSRSAGSEDTPKSDMLSEIQSIQKKSGFY